MSRSVVVSLVAALLLALLAASNAFLPRVLTAHKRPMLRMGSNDAVEEEEEWHPRDPAYTTPQLLVGLWSQIAQAGTMTRGESNTVLYPDMAEKFSPRYLNLVMAHLDACKDVCDHFGITTSLEPVKDKKTGQVNGFTAKSFRNPNKKDDYDFDYDPFWDDGTDFDALYKNIDDDYDDGPAKDPYPEIANKVPDNDEEIIDISKKWVSKMMSDMGICPFTQGAEQAGLPMGNVFYTVDRCAGFEDMYCRYWKEVVRLEQNNEKDVSTILLITPEFCMDNIELFDSFTNTLTQPLAALEIEDLLQLVFFHPHWSFRDGGARSGEGTAANYARRSPWPMFNLLRTSQVRAAQKGIPTGLVYKQNEKTLKSVGAEKLETMLRLRDWGEIADLKVNRKEIDALKIAQDFQNTGVVKQEDMTVAHDATPAASKVDRKQVEEGNLVNVVLQALGKRLGKGDESAVALSGPETSATAMAVDFLVEELDSITERLGESQETKKEATESSSVEEKSATTNNNEGAEETEYQETEELKRAKASRMEAARSAIFNDLRDGENSGSGSGGDRSTGRGSPDADALFGKSGIAEALSEEDELFQEGMNPDSFY